MKPSPSDASERCGATLRSLAITYPVPRCWLKRSSSAQLCSAQLCCTPHGVTHWQQPAQLGRVFPWCETCGSSCAVVVQMTRVKVAACNQYSTCTECLAAADAYCGWCTMETR